uniref:Ig-like domain-containing protein n=1 Tax=Sinocyclocheilus grahami TaxID=75366 RepID=A0A672KH98_SINGR
MLCWVLILPFVGFLKAQENPVVIYAQVGGTVTLQRYRVEGNADNVYVNWYRGSDTIPTIMKNPQSGIQKGEIHVFQFIEMKTHADLLSDFSLQISPVQHSDFEIWRCVQHVLLATTVNTYKLYHDLSPFPDTIYTSYSSSTVDIPCSFFSNIPWSVLKESGFRGGSWSFTPLSDPKSTQSLLSLSVDPVVRWNITQGANNTIKVKGRELKDHDLSIRNLPVSENIRGVYTCDLKFNTKTLSSEVTVEVLKGK